MLTPGGTEEQSKTTWAGTLSFESSEKAIAIDPTAARAWIVRGFALHNLSRYEDAVASYARAIELNPFGAEGRRAWNSRGAYLTT